MTSRIALVSLTCLFTLTPAALGQLGEVDLDYWWGRDLSAHSREECERHRDLMWNTRVKPAIMSYMECFKRIGFQGENVVDRCQNEKEKGEIPEGCLLEFIKKCTESISNDAAFSRCLKRLTPREAGDPSAAFTLFREAIGRTPAFRFQGVWEIGQQWAYIKRLDQHGNCALSGTREEVTAGQLRGARVKGASPSELVVPGGDFALDLSKVSGIDERLGIVSVTGPGVTSQGGKVEDSFVFILGLSAYAEGSERIVFTIGNVDSSTRRSVVETLQQWAVICGAKLE